MSRAPSRYPVPNRRNHKPNINLAADKEYLDVGWSAGVLSDGRPFRVEYWWWQDVSILTYYMSTKDIETVSEGYFRELLMDEGLLTFVSHKPTLKARKIRDASGNEMWAVNVAVGDDEQLFVEGPLPMKCYNRNE